MSALEQQAQSLPAARAVLAAIHMTGNLGLAIDRAKAFQLCMEDAKTGYSYAEYLIAWIFAEDGHPLQAANWMRKSAVAGFPPAQFDMGRLYLNGIGVKKDRQLAMTWLWKATRSGHVIALRGLLQQYMAGWYGLARQVAATIVWPFTRPFVYLYWRMNGPNSQRFFFYDWPNVGRQG